MVESVMPATANLLQSSSRMGRSNSSPAPSSPASTPPGVYRLDKQLLVPRGADLSRACLVCGKPAVDGAIVRRLPAARWVTRQAVGPAAASAMFWWDAIAFVLSIAMFAFDYPARRKRVVKIGFCEAHRGKYFGYRWGGVLAGIMGLVLMVWMIASRRLPDWLQPILFIAGAGLLLTSYFLRASVPTLRLVRETKAGMWVGGAGKPFLEMYPPAPVVSAPK